MTRTERNDDASQRSQFSLIEEPIGEVYERLLKHALGATSKAMVVARDDLGLDDGGLDCLRRLEPFMIMKERRSEWPGTLLLGHEASVYTIRYEPGSYEIIRSACRGLYDWRQPD